MHCATIIHLHSFTQIFRWMKYRQIRNSGPIKNNFISLFFKFRIQKSNTKVLFVMGYYEILHLYECEG